MLMWCCFCCQGHENERAYIATQGTLRSGLTVSLAPMCSSPYLLRFHHCCPLYSVYIQFNSVTLYSSNIGQCHQLAGLKTVLFCSLTAKCQLLPYFAPPFFRPLITLVFAFRQRLELLNTSDTPKGKPVVIVAFSRLSTRSWSFP